MSIQRNANTGKIARALIVLYPNAYTPDQLTEITPLQRNQVVMALRRLVEVGAVTHNKLFDKYIANKGITIK